jgi:hypothetical protein
VTRLRMHAGMRDSGGSSPTTPQPMNRSWSTGENRELSTCADCGHPRMAHLGGACYCGCPRATAVAEPVSRRPLSAAAPAVGFHARTSLERRACPADRSHCCSEGICCADAAHLRVDPELRRRNADARGDRPLRQRTSAPSNLRRATASAAVKGCRFCLLPSSQRCIDQQASNLLRSRGGFVVTMVTLSRRSTSL